VEEGSTPDSISTVLVWSADSGSSWRQAQLSDKQAWLKKVGIEAPDSGYGSGFMSLGLSPVAPQRLYAVVGGGFYAPNVVARSDDAGRSFKVGNDPAALLGSEAAAGFRTWGTLSPDPRRLNAVYVNVLRLDPRTSATVPGYAARSDDAGLTWTMVITPTASPPLQAFTVSTDPHEGSQLVGTGYGPKVPADRRYLSADQGRTWKVARCPGDRKGHCPAFTLANVFGAGASYAFQPDGVYRFQGGGPATIRLTLSDHLPLPIPNLIDVEGGTKAGDPIYLLGARSYGDLHNPLYRSADGGKTWRPLLTGAFPVTAPPTCTPDQQNLGGTC
jgi:hypothetical protein